MSKELVLSVGWALLHSIWQIGLIGLFALGLERLLYRVSAQIRHQLLLFFLGITMLTCAATFYLEWQHFIQLPSFARNVVEGAGQTDPDILQLTSSPLPSPAPLPILLRCKIWLEQHLIWLVVLWLSGMAYFSFRFSWNYWSLLHLRNQGFPLNDSRLLMLVANIREAVGLRKSVRFYLHPSLSSPLTFGFFRPVVLLPLALLCQSSPELVGALLRHELIHIRRSDYLINLWITGIQILLFYHPVIWMFTRRIEELREEACDEAVVQSGCDKLLYAEALLQLQRLNHHQNIPLGMQAQNQSSHFARRVRQILERPLNSAFYPRIQLWSVALPLILGLSLFALGRFKPTLPQEKKQSVLENTTQARTLLIPEPKAMEPQPAYMAPQKKPASTLSPKLVIVEATPLQNIDTFPQSTQDMVLSVAAERMNVLYMGIDNPISVAISGIPADQVKVSSNSVKLTSVGKGKYIAKVGAPGKATILVEAPNYKQEVEFRVKPIPDPIAVLKNFGTRSGFMRIAELKELKGLESKLFNFDMDADCPIIGFNVIYVEAGNSSPKQATNQGGTFSSVVLEMISNPKEGDDIIFDNIRVKCPGDAANRKINNLSFRIIKDN